VQRWLKAKKRRRFHFLGVARAYAGEGNTNQARAAYRGFLGFWSNADPDVPVYKQAKAELAALR
jgi:hypothetical protein